MATFEKPRIVVEQSPWATALPTLADTLVNLYSLSKQMELRASEAQLARDFTTTQGELSFARQLYVGQKEREALLEEQVLAIGALPDSGTTPGGQEIIGMNSEGLFEEMQGTENYMDELQTIISQQKAGIKDIKGLQDRFSNIIEAGKDKDEAVKDYMITGGLEIDPATGEPIGSDEWEAILNKLKTGTKAEQLEYEKFRSEAYISGVEESLRGIEEANALVMVDQQISSNKLNIKAANQQMAQGNYDMFLKILNENDKVFGDIYNQQGLAIASGINIGGLGIQQLQAMEADDYRDLMEDIMENYPAVAKDLGTFLNTIAIGGQLGADVMESLTRTQSHAYEDFLQLNQTYKVIYEDVNPGVSFNPANSDHQNVVRERLSEMGTKDKTYLEVKRLENRVEGFKRIGIYNTGIPRMERSFSVIQAHDEQENVKLESGTKEWEKIAVEGYPVDLEMYEPENIYQMSGQDWMNMEVSLAALKSYTPPLPGGPPLADDLSSQMTTSAGLTDQLKLLNKSGFQGTKVYENISDSLTTLNQEIRSKQSYEDYVANIEKKMAMGTVSDEELVELSSLLGIDIEDLRATLEERRVRMAESRQPIHRAAYESRLQR